MYFLYQKSRDIPASYVRLPEGIRYNGITRPSTCHHSILGPPPRPVVPVTQAVVASGGFSLDPSWHPNLGAGFPNSFTTREGLGFPRGWVFLFGCVGGGRIGGSCLDIEFPELGWRFFCKHKRKLQVWIFCWVF